MQAAALELDAQAARTLYIPPGVAHGYLALTDAHLVYLVTQEYDGSDEWGIRWDDPSVAIPWMNDDPILSARDRSNPFLDWDQMPSFR